MPTNQPATDPLSQYQQSQRDNVRKQMLAQLLIQSGGPQPQGQMVGRFYVPPSPVQRLSSVAGNVLGAKALGDVTTSQLDAKNKLYASLLGGTPQAGQATPQQGQAAPQGAVGGFSGAPAGVSPQAWNMALAGMATGDQGLSHLGTMIQDANKPHVVSEGGALVGPGGNLITVRPKVGEGMQPTGYGATGELQGVQSIPGYGEALTANTAAQEKGKAQYDLVKVPLPNGQEQMMTRAEYAAYRQGLDRGGSEGLGTTQSPAVAEANKKKLEETDKVGQQWQNKLGVYDEIERIIKTDSSVLGPGLIDRAKMAGHKYGLQDQSTMNTQRVRELGSQLTLAMGSLGNQVSDMDRATYERAQGSFENAKSKQDMTDSLKVMRNIATKYMATANQTRQSVEAGTPIRYGNKQIIPTGQKAQQTEKNLQDLQNGDYRSLWRR